MTTLGIQRPFLFAGLLTVLVFFGRAEANLMWHWTGECTTAIFPSNAPLCGHATFDAVTTDNYVPGTVGGQFGGAPGRLLTVVYEDDTGVSTAASFGVDNFGAEVDTFVFPADSGQNFGSIATPVSTFRSSADGTWRFESAFVFPGCNGDNNGGNPFCGYTTSGINGTWTVPAPATLSLVALGLLLVVAAPRYRRRKLDRTVPAD